MEKGRKRIHVFLICLVLLAVVVGLFYYYYEVQSEITSDEGTLISNICLGMRHLWLR